MSNLEFIVGIKAKEKPKDIKDIKAKLESYKFITNKEYVYRHLLRYYINMLYNNIDNAFKTATEVEYSGFQQEFLFLEKVTDLLENNTIDDFKDKFLYLVEDYMNNPDRKFIIPYIDCIQKALILIVKDEKYNHG